MWFRAVEGLMKSDRAILSVLKPWARRDTASSSRLVRAAIG
jgi:hypothetical protein